MSSVFDYFVILRAMRDVRGPILSDVYSVFDPADIAHRAEDDKVVENTVHV